MRLHNNFFAKIILFNIAIITTLRLIEILLIYINFGIEGGWITSETIGIGIDILLTSALLTTCYPLYWLFFSKKPELGNRIFAFTITTLGVLHLLILKYFLYQLSSLDQFLYQYPFKEIVFTVKTSNTNYLSLVISLVILIIVTWFSFKQTSKWTFNKKAIYTIYGLLCIAVIFSITAASTGFLFSNKYIQNKPIYFYARSIAFFVGDKTTNSYTPNDTEQYQKIYQGKSYTSSEYPLLHKFDSTDVIGNYFNKSNKLPNVVILIVEGLNDDFIHSYKGVNIMPSLTSLKDKSLYWNRCFTLGERSFAAVPCILGGLPYGEKGFTLLEQLPYHLSLVSILGANNYYTTFFYGQGSWFHQKGRFFEYNHADLVFDNKKFTPKYKKIIVGSDNFFLGYHDKDLFNQSLEVIDTLPKKPRLDVYFTGTSHGPYVEKESVYSGKLVDYTRKTNNPNFFKTYGNYIKSLLYVDDAIADFIRRYQKREDFANTIFIITGDHPMTQLPRANSLKRYHVPLIIYSPLLNKAKEFSNTVSHLDIYETLLAYLGANYNINVPTVSTSLGDKLIPSNNNTSKKVAFMDDNRDIIDFYSDGYYIASNNNLFKVGKGFTLTPITDPKRLQMMQQELNVFKKTSLFVSTHEKIIAPTQYYESLSLKPLLFIDEQKDVATKTEFHDLTDAITVPNRGLTLHASMNYSGQAAENSILVYQLTNQKDSTILWQSCSFPKNGNKLSIQVKIPIQSAENTTLKFKAYIWNHKKVNISYSNLRMLLYEPTAHQPINTQSGLAASK